VPLKIQWNPETIRHPIVVPNGTAPAQTVTQNGIIHFVREIDPELAGDFYGKVNGVRNGIYPPEALVISEYWHSDLKRLGVIWCRTIGVCEDGVRRFVGWNRFYRTSGIWRPHTLKELAEMDKQGGWQFKIGTDKVYTHADAVVLGGFDALEKYQE
jgi:hypothetical protein